MNFAQIYGQVALQFDSMALTNVKSWVNSAAHEFYDRRKFAWREAVATFASVSGQQDYVLAGAAPVVPDFDGLISLRHNAGAGSTTYTKLAEFFQDDFDELFAFAGPTPGIPTCFTVRGSTPASSSSTVHSGGEQVFSTYAVTNYAGSFRMGYYRAAGSIEMVNDSDVPLAPPQYHRAIVDLAIAIGLSVEDQMIQNSVFSQRAEQMIQSAIAADMALRQADRSKMAAPGRQPPTDPRQGPPYGYPDDRG